MPEGGGTPPIYVPSGHVPSAEDLFGVVACSKSAEGTYNVTHLKQYIFFAYKKTLIFRVRFYGGVKVTLFKYCIFVEHAHETERIGTLDHAA